MTATSVCIKTRIVVINDCVDKVSEVISAAFKLLYLFQIFIKGNAIIILNLDKVSFGTVRDDADFRSKVILSFKSAGLKN